jgi:hypothetical protein
MLVHGYDLRFTFLLRNLNGNDVAFEELGVVGPRPALMASQSKCNLIFPIHLILFRNVFGGLGHRIDSEMFLYSRIHKAPTDCGIVNLSSSAESGLCFRQDKRRSRHAFDTPAIISSDSPDLIARAPIAMASKLDPQRRLIVAPGTTSGNPASNRAIRPTFRLSSPA